MYILDILLMIIVLSFIPSFAMQLFITHELLRGVSGKPLTASILGS